MLKTLATTALLMKNFLITGALGFIGSCLISKLNKEGITDIIAVDDFSSSRKKQNLNNKKILSNIQREEFLDWLELNESNVDFIFHLGARTDTTEQSIEIFDILNLNYSKDLFTICTKYQIPVIYASSASTYGNGELGYVDYERLLSELQPLNPYAWSKHKFDMWVLEQEKKPYFWTGLKFFNVYGPNEYHKGKMASVIYHSFNQIKEQSKINLFQSHKEGIENGHQSRDFIYVWDVVDVLIWFYKTRLNSGIYNLGTGKARTYLDLAKSVFKSMNIKEDIDFIPTPTSIRDSYQYFTQANMDKLRSIGYTKSFTSLEDGIEDYITNYLIKGDSYV